MSHCLKLIVFCFIMIGSLSISFGQSDPNVQIEIVTQEKIQGIITLLAYSPDGKLIASGSEKENSIKVWDISSGKIIGKLKGHEGATTAIEFNSDGTKLISSAKDNKTILWSLLKWEMIDSITVSAPIIDFEENPATANSFYGASEDGKLVCWNEADFKNPETLFSKEESYRKIALDKSIIALGDESGNLTVYSLEHKQVLISKKIYSFSIVGLEFYENGTRLISAGSNGKINLWDINSLEESKSINASALPITAFDVNVSEKLFVTVSQSRVIKVWNLEGDLLHEYTSEVEESGIREPIRALKISPDGSTMASSGFRNSTSRTAKENRNVIRIWDLQRGTLHASLEGSVNPIYSFDFHPTENKLVTLGDNHTLTFWDFDVAEKYGELELQEPNRELAGVRKDITLDKVSRFKDALVRASNGDLGGITDAAKGKDIGVGLAKRMFKERSIIMFTEQGNHLITKLEKDEIRLYNFNEGTPTYDQSLYSYQAAINQLLSSPDENYLAVLGSGDSAISIIDLRSKKFITKLSTSAPKDNFKYIYEANSLAFSPDGKLLAVCFNTGKTFVFSTVTWTMVFENILPDNLGYVESPFVNFSKNGEYMVVKTMMGLRKYNTKTFDIFNTEPLKVDGYSAPMDRPEDYAISIKDNYVYFEDLFSGEVKKSIRVQPNQITNIAINPGGLVGITFSSGQFQLLNPKTGEEEVLLVADGDNYIFKTAENFYKVSKEGYDLVTFRIGNQAFPFEQFDAIFNRPDLVLKKMGCTDTDLMALYEKAYLKRIKKLGLQPTTVIRLTDIPKLVISNSASIPAITEKEFVKADFKMTDGSNLQSYNIWVNNVPMYGKKGKKTSGKSQQVSAEISLIFGLNKIQIACQNASGYESLIQTFYVEKEGPKPQRDLYLITIGTSEYKDSRYNLNYPAKDANDLVALMQTNESGLYGKINTKSLIDKAVTSENIIALKDFLNQSRPNDVVVVFVAGHGVLDANFDYYFGTYNIDFSNPSVKGLAYEKLEQILDGIKANKKILIMDTCHSGEVDKEDVFFADNNAQEEKEEDITFRAVGAAVNTDESKATPTRLAGELFNDLRKGTGATVISSAGGVEFAMESAEWKNGLFTYCLLNGLKNRTADLNGDGKIMLLELQTYVVDKVRALSHGRQVPNTRIKNIELDFQIW